MRKPSAQRLQSAPVYPKKHSQVPVGVRQKPCLEHGEPPGGAGQLASLKGQSPGQPVGFWVI